MKKKVAIVQDNLLEFGGSEKVLEALIKLYPDADLFTFFINRANPQIDQKFGKYDWRCSPLQSLPWLANLQQYFSLLKPLAWRYFARLDLQAYDLIFTSSHSYNSKLVKKRPDALHICYLHTPPRFLYGYAHELSMFTRIGIWRAFLSWLRQIDQQAGKQPDVIIVNSREVQQRVKKIYKRPALVVPPPVELLFSSYPVLKKTRKEPKYFVAHSRLVKQKGIKLIVDACTQLGLPLRVIGDGYLRKELEKEAGPSVTFLGFVPEKKLGRVYRSAIALLYAAEDEDFGIVPVEAQSAGVPVLAYKSGGVVETVKEGETGYFFEERTVESLMKVIQKLQKRPLKMIDCFRQAQKFRPELFAQNIQRLATHRSVQS